MSTNLRKAQKHMQRATELLNQGQLGFGTARLGFSSPSTKWRQKSDDTAKIINALRQSKEVYEMVEEQIKKFDLRKIDCRPTALDRINICKKIQNKLQENECELLRRITGSNRNYVSEYEIVEVEMEIYYDLKYKVDWPGNDEQITRYEPEKEEGVWFNYNEPKRLLSLDDDERRRHHLWLSYIRGVHPTSDTDYISCENVKSKRSREEDASDKTKKKEARNILDISPGSKEITKGN